MKRLASVFCLVFLFLGCATNQRPEQVNGLDLNQQLDAYIDDYYNQVVNLCVEMQGLSNERKSVVGCGIRGSALHISFPSQAYHDSHVDDVGRLYNHWCSAYGSKTGKPGTWVRYFRDQKKVEWVNCRKRKVS